MLPKATAVGQIVIPVLPEVVLVPRVDHADLEVDLAASLEVDLAANQEADLAPEADLEVDHARGASLVVDLDPEVDLEAGRGLEADQEVDLGLEVDLVLEANLEVVPAPEVNPKAGRVQEANLGVGLVLEADLVVGHDQGADQSQEVGHGLGVALGHAADLELEQGEIIELHAIFELLLFCHLRLTLFSCFLCSLLVLLICNNFLCYHDH